MDYKKFYFLEQYLSDEIRNDFTNNGYISAEQFFCIVIWKANRSKSKIAKRLLGKGYKSLDSAAKKFTGDIYKLENPKDRMALLIEEWGFRLPMASAILSILYPNDFTVYDVRVCNMLGGFHDLVNKTNFENIWKDYLKFLNAVNQKVPHENNFRDKDQYLWGKSFYEDLRLFLCKKYSL